MPRVQFSRPVLSLALGLILCLPLQAQNRAFDRGPSIHGVPPSVTSWGFGGVRGPHGVPPSVTSLGFGDVRLRFHQGPFPLQRRFPGQARFLRHQHGQITPFFVYLYAPYYPNYGSPYDVFEPGVDDSMEEDYRGDPTMYDPRGQEARDYLRLERQAEGRQQDASLESAAKEKPITETPPQAPPPVAEQPSTILVFRDRHELEVSNYAIVGETLYDLTGGHTRKVALAELDLAATVKQNDQHGVDFRLPGGVKVD